MYTLSVTIDAASGLLQVLMVTESDSPSSLFLYLGCKGFVCSHANCTVKNSQVFNAHLMLDFVHCDKCWLRHATYWSFAEITFIKLVALMKRKHDDVTNILPFVTFREDNYAQR